MPAAYQWQRNGVDIPGATRFTYRPAVQASDRGVRYQVRLSNSAGSVTSDPATLTVLDAPTGNLSLFAGSIGGAGNLDGVGAAARFNGPFGLAADADGNILVAAGQLREVAPSGVVSTSTFRCFLGGLTGIAVDAAANRFTASSDRFPSLTRSAPDGSIISSVNLTQSAYPVAIALDAAGRVIVVDTGANQLRRIDPVSGESVVLAVDPNRPTGGADATGLFSNVCGVAVDIDGSIVFTEQLANTVRRLLPDGGNQLICQILPGGNLSVIAGAVGSAGSKDGPATSARFELPQALALVGNGDMLIDDNHTVRRLDRAGNVTTIAGLAAAAPGSGYLLQKITPAGNTTTLASGLSNPQGMALDAAGNVYIADSGRNCSGSSSVPANCTYYGLLMKFDASQARLGVLAGTLRKISADGTVTTVAGVAPAGCGSVEGLAPPKRPRAVAVDRLGFLYIASAVPSAVYQLSPSGELTQLAGDQVPAPQGNGSLGSPVSIAVDNARNVYVGGAFGRFEGALYKVAPNGLVTTLVPREAGLGVPAALAVDHTGAVLFSNPIDKIIRAVSATGVVTVRASGVAAAGLAIGADGTILFSQRDESTIRKLDPAGNVVDVAGAAEPFELLFRGNQAADSAGNVYVLEQLSQPGSTGLVLQRIAPNGQKTALLNGVVGTEGLAADTAGNVYLSQSVQIGTGCGYRACFPTYGSKVTKLDAQGQVAKLPRIYTDASGNEISLDRVNALATDASGNLYVADREPNDTAIYRIAPAGAITTVATGRFNLSDIAVDAQGTNVYASTCPIANNQTGPQIVRYGLGGTSTVLAGSPIESGAADGIGRRATFGSCQLGITLDQDNNVFVADTANSTVRKVTAAGEVSTLVGRAGVQGITLGPLPASLSGPIDVSFEGAGNLYVGSVHAILKVRLGN